MGPLFFRAENLYDGPSMFDHSESFNGAALFQSGEHRAGRGGARGNRTLQWGRSFSERRTLRGRSAPTPGRTRFNGAALFQSGEPCTSPGSGIAIPASMGPLFFRAENHATQEGPESEDDQLQWGRSFSERRTLRPSWYSESSADASMGPLFFRAENWASQLGVETGGRASMGPLFFRAENSPPRKVGKRVKPASMGPLFFRAENP